MATGFAPPSGTPASDAPTHPALASASHGGLSRVPYLPALDGLRALAVVAVIVYHANHEWMLGGYLGVEVFFVISGYLITLLLVGEHDRTGRISLRQFWLRRFRRLLPALFAMMTALAIYMAVFDRRPMGQVRGDLVGGASYISNWYQIWVGQGYGDASKFVPLRHLWSLAVEEQFYVVWPLVMMVLLRRAWDRQPKLAAWMLGVALAVAAIVAAISVGWGGGDIDSVCNPATGANGYAVVFGRCVSVNDALYLSTISRSTGLLLGAAFAMVWRPVAVMRGPLRNRAGRVDVIAAVALVALILLARTMYLTTEGREAGQRFNPWLFRGGLLLVGLLSLMLIAAATHRRSIVGRLVGIRPLRWIGTRSYGLYLYHWPIFQIIRREAGLALTFNQFVAAMALTVLCTELSYRLIETPIRGGALGAWWRDRGTRSASSGWRPRQMAAAAGLAVASFAGFSVALADNVCVGATQCSIEAAGAGLLPPVPATLPPSASTPPTVSDPSTDGSQPPPVVTEPGPDGSVAPTPGSDPPPPTPSDPPVTQQPPPAGPPPLALGESVMAGAVSQLNAGGLAVDAAVGRQGGDMAALVSFYAQSGLIGDIVVIQIGTNGRVSDETYAAIMAPLVDVPLVVFVTVSAPRGWIADNNTRIWNLPSVYPNVRVADWASLAPTVALCDDGYHVSCNGAAGPYAQLILDTVAANRPAA